MTWFADLTPCDFISSIADGPFLAVGWLRRAGDFPTGSTSRDVFARLVDLVRDPWQPFVTAGNHECDLCQFEPEAVGSKNLFVPGDGVIYVAPELITHHINAHRYRPPEEFCKAVLACPPMQSIDYKRMLLENGARQLIQSMSGKHGGDCDD